MAPKDNRPVAAVSVGEILRHVPGIDCNGRVVACCCGWKLQGMASDYWETFWEHVPRLVPSGKLVLTETDAAFLQACHIALSDK